MHSGIVTLMTDFGTRDSYVGIMKGVILGADPSIRIVDISHEVPSFQVVSASYMLWSYHDWFPRGTVHCVVVDPGVGSERAPIAVEVDGNYFVLPDNGLISMVIAGREDRYSARRIDNPDFRLESVSATFHGRDIFAPSAARLASGSAFEDAGPEIHEPVILPVSRPRIHSGVINGAVVHMDRFGNYITNISREALDVIQGGAIFINIGGFSIMGICRTYSDRNTGELVAYIGSTGMLEIGAVRASAVDIVTMPVGADVMVRGREPGGGF